MTKIKRW